MRARCWARGGANGGTGAGGQTMLHQRLKLLDPNSARARYREMLLAAAEAGNDLRGWAAQNPAEDPARPHIYFSRAATPAAAPDADDNKTPPTPTSIPP